MDLNRIEKISPRPDVAPVVPVPLLTPVERELERERREGARERRDDMRKRRRRAPKRPPAEPGHVDQLA